MSLCRPLVRVTPSPYGMPHGRTLFFHITIAHILMGPFNLLLLLCRWRSVRGSTIYLLPSFVWFDANRIRMAWLTNFGPTNCAKVMRLKHRLPFRSDCTVMNQWMMDHCVPDMTALHVAHEPNSNQSGQQWPNAHACIYIRNVEQNLFWLAWRPIVVS